MTRKLKERIRSSLAKGLENFYDDARASLSYLVLKITHDIEEETYLNISALSESPNNRGMINVPIHGTQYEKEPETALRPLLRLWPDGDGFDVGTEENYSNIYLSWLAVEDVIHLLELGEYILKQASKTGCLAVIPAKYDDSAYIYYK